ncbi:MAG TPA: molybdopterin converting factor subunit 1 [Rhodospirillaceae bacterium]|nr:molybdopterin converting factor subunit 1 [Rhodospirillaceae bacterium]HAT34465.1 molybdopterin converting factor subunit 1 [Rhodospirillaceae bacterium]|tara:strand:- start:324 stop:575 length:252 start_codon:yes stop_codon:yes gene_type:complete
MKLLYFAWIRQQTGLGEEEVDVPETVADVAGLIKWLRSRGPQFAAALEDVSTIRIAVNQQFAEMDTPVADGDEVALFPPMTGG